MKTLSIATVSAIALVATAPFLTQISVLTLISQSSSAIAQTPQKQGPVKIELQGEKKVVTKDAQGKETVTWQTVKDKVKSGDVLRYTVVAENKSNKQITNLILKGPIPKGMEFVLKSVQAPNNAEVTYSIDGGKTFVANPTVNVIVNGKKETKPAPANTYTHVRVKLPVVAAKATVKTTYETQVR